MDPVAAARRLVAAIGTPAAAQWVHHEAADFLEQAPRGAAVLEVVMKRNVVFVSWAAGAASGTWMLAFDREGRLMAWRGM